MLFETCARCSLTTNCVIMCIVVHTSDNNVKVADDNVLWRGLSDNSVRSVGTCNLCLMYYMASLASGGFEFYVLTNGCLNQLFQVQVQESLHLLHIQVQLQVQVLEQSSCRISSSCSTYCISWSRIYKMTRFRVLLAINVLLVEIVILCGCSILTTQLPRNPGG